MDSISLAVAAFVGAASAGALIWLAVRRKRGETDALRQRYEEEVRNRATAEERARQAEDLRGMLADVEQRLSEATNENASLKARMEEQQKAAGEKIEELTKLRQEMLNDFQRLAGEALQKNEKSFLNLAEQIFEKHKSEAKTELEKRQEAVTNLVKPINETLERYKESLNAIEKERVGAYKAIQQQVRDLIDAQTAIRTETSKLVQALRSPKVRGRWGEFQLRNVLEMAGMAEHTDFIEQRGLDTDDRRLYPDVVVRLPGGKSIIIDAKTPLDAYLAAIEATDEGVRQARMIDHARQVRAHLRQLSSKEYWKALPGTPDFVVMFIPGESFFAAAIEAEPTLFEDGAKARILLATPTTLIALVKAIAYGWQQDRLAENARNISELGRELYDRITIMGNHMSQLGKGLRGAVQKYNSVVGSLEGRVLPAARRFKELHVVPASADIALLEPVDHEPRHLQSEEFIATGVRSGGVAADGE